MYDITTCGDPKDDQRPIILETGTEYDLFVCCISLPFDSYSNCYSAIRFCTNSSCQSHSAPTNNEQAQIMELP
jgi:hypothetical protein